MPKSEEARAIEALTKAVERLEKSLDAILGELRAARRERQTHPGR